MSVQASLQHAPQDQGLQAEKVHDPPSAAPAEIQAASVPVPFVCVFGRDHRELGGRGKSKREC